MDPERQPLLNSGAEIRSRKLRPLTHEEVIDCQTDAKWRRVRFCLIFMFWAIIAMFLSMVACILIQAPKCGPHDVDLGLVPSVPPVHMTFAPLIASGRASNLGRDLDDSGEAAYIM